ncbi:MULTISPECIES: hypothetical protein [unclassified Mesorhizobium]|uniref:hypothetical protein n=1 Tax=unclassified Mesorhizobium TaxID=325217 RepID=UPI00142EE72A|nr:MULTISPECIES: hypothetical protein [unclassified Mesorhizobium]
MAVSFRTFAWLEYGKVMRGRVYLSDIRECVLRRAFEGEPEQPKRTSNKDANRSYEALLLDRLHAFAPSTKVGHIFLQLDWIAGINAELEQGFRHRFRDDLLKLMLGHLRSLPISLDAVL